MTVLSWLNNWVTLHSMKKKWMLYCNCNYTKKETKKYGKFVFNIGIFEKLMSEGHIWTFLKTEVKILNIRNNNWALNLPEKAIGFPGPVLLAVAGRKASSPRRIRIRRRLWTRRLERHVVLRQGCFWNLNACSGQREWRRSCTGLGEGLRAEGVFGNTTRLAPQMCLLRFLEAVDDLRRSGSLPTSSSSLLILPRVTQGF